MTERRANLVLLRLDLDLLRTLAWAAPLTTDHLNRLVAPGMTRSGLSKRLRRLMTMGLITRELHYRRPPGTAPTRVGNIWVLTPRGSQTLPEDLQRPPVVAGVRRSLLEHDLVVADLLATIVEYARPILSGMHVLREVRLDATQPKPKCDAVVVVRTGSDPPQTAVPWVNAPQLPEEEVRGWAVEVDRGTEALSIIAAKAVAYRTVATDPAFYHRYGALPIPLWIAPDRARAEAILSAWAAVWPAGRCLLMTDASLPGLVASAYRDGNVQQTTLLAGWDLPPRGSLA